MRKSVWRWRTECLRVLSPTVQAISGDQLGVLAVNILHGTGPHSGDQRNGGTEVFDESRVGYVMARLVAIGGEH